MSAHAANPRPLRALYLEDSELDAELVSEALARSEDLLLKVDVAPDKATFETLLAGPPYDVVLSDFSLPGYDAFAALSCARAACPLVPFICVSGTIGEEATVELLKQGADDCVLKDHLARLPFAIRRAIDDRERERALRESESLHRSILHASPDNISVTDLEGRLRIASPTAMTMFGLTGEQEFVGRPLTDFLVPEDRERASAAIGRMLREDVSAPSEYRGLRSDGASFPIEVNGEFIRDSEGQPTSMVFVARDTSERKRIEEALRERERTLSTLMSNLPGMAFRCADDPAWTMLFVSDGCEELTGYAPEALVGNAAISFFDLMHPDDVAAERADTEAAIDRGEPWTTTYRIRSASGALKWVRERGVAVEIGDEERVLEGFIQDVTDQHDAEARLEAASAEWRRTFDAMSDSVAVFDAEGRVVRCNRATADLTGRDFAEITGHRCYEVFHGADDYHESCPQRLSIASGRQETSVFEQDGRWLRATFEPHVDDAGRVDGGVHVVSDVTELKQSEERLLASIAKQKRITDGVIVALSRAVEVRDPYTAGHERRVSQLAAAVAGRMGLDEEAVHRVHVTGMLHDIGKILVPAEILSKPGRLTPTEFELIKSHPETAHSILDSIEFDFPASEIILQHHERLDGSGYPAGLKDDEILPEARILAVADVAEAMISHRPYRAGLPLEAAIDELENGAGTRYDADAVAATIEVLCDEEFVFDE